MEQYHLGYGSPSWYCGPTTLYATLSVGDISVRLRSADQWSTSSDQLLRPQPADVQPIFSWASSCRAGGWVSPVTMLYCWLTQLACCPLLMVWPAWCPSGPRTGRSRGVSLRFTSAVRTCKVNRSQIFCYTKVSQYKGNYDTWGSYQSANIGPDKLAAWFWKLGYFNNPMWLKIMTNTANSFLRSQTSRNIPSI